MEGKNLIAAAGLQKIRTAQILHIIAVILTTVGALAALSGAVIAGGSAMDNNEALALGALGVAGIGGLMTLAGFVIAMVSFVMEMLGMHKAGPAHPSYKTALYMVLVNIALGLVAILVTGNTIFSGILQALSPIVVFLSVYFVLSATVALLREKGDEASAAKGTTIRTMYLVCTAVSVAGNLIAAWPALTGATGVAGVATTISSVVQIVALFMYIGFLGRSVHTLSE